MDLKEYISSGILENYVLGNVSSQERKEVDCLSQIYPEIKQELVALQEAVENMGIKASIIPPKELKSRTLSQIKSIHFEREEQEHLNSPNDDSPTVKTISFRYRNIAAACIICLIGLGTYTFFLYKDVDKKQLKISQLNTTIEDKNQAFDAANKNYANAIREKGLLTEEIAFLKHQNTSKIQLSGTESHQSDKAIVFWNDLTERVLLDVESLTEKTDDHSYQLWVLVDGSPINKGVFDNYPLDENNPFLEMESTQEADAFAITIEPKGGSSTPSLDNLCVIGNI